ncbi:MAG: helix-turn-helix domain-containing protein [Deltaproteobacteria bacterium]|jgi:DNA-binding XRE family transcriptional regulator|nr:helix-turn-helix domain-containing protein [Deltaproteobacteria bacterium]
MDIIYPNGTALEAERIKQMIGRNELAHKAGVNPGTIRRIERGEWCNPNTMRKVLIALGVDLADASRFYFPANSQEAAQAREAFQTKKALKAKITSKGKVGRPRKIPTE